MQTYPFSSEVQYFFRKLLMQATIWNLNLGYSRLAFDCVQERNVVGVILKLFKLGLVENMLLERKITEDLIDLALRAVEQGCDIIRLVHTFSETKQRVRTIFHLLLVQVEVTAYHDFTHLVALFELNYFDQSFVHNLLIHTLIALSLGRVKV